MKVKTVLENDSESVDKAEDNANEIMGMIMTRTMKTILLKMKKNDRNEDGNADRH